MLRHTHKAIKILPMSVKVAESGQEVSQSSSVQFSTPDIFVYFSPHAGSSAIWQLGIHFWRQDGGHEERRTNVLIRWQGRSQGQHVVSVLTSTDGEYPARPHARFPDLPSALHQAPQNAVARLERQRPQANGPLLRNVAGGRAGRDGAGVGPAERPPPAAALPQLLQRPHRPVHRERLHVTLPKIRTIP